MKKLSKPIVAKRQFGTFPTLRSTGHITSFPKGMPYEMIRRIDESQAYFHFGNTPNIIYLVEDKELIEQAIQYPRQMADFAPPPQKPVSLDQVVDRYIVRYERESIPLEGGGMPGPGPASGQGPAGNPNITLESTLDEIINFVMQEQAAPADDPNAVPEDAPPGGDINVGGDNGGGTPGTGAPSGPPVVNTPQININDFCRSVARLVNNFEPLLNPKTIILNRVEAYIQSNYDERTAKYFRQIMERNYGLTSTSTEYPEAESEFPTSYGASALPSASGGGGG